MEVDETPLTLGDVVTLQRGITYKSALLGQPGPVLLGLASIQRNGGFRDDNLKTYGGDSPEKLTLRPGDIYVSLKDVTQSADLLGAVARVPPHVPTGRVTQDTVKLTFIRKDVPSRYLYWLLRTPVYREYCRAHAIGTTNLSIAREDFLAFPVPNPKTRELTLVETLDALDDKIELNRRMNATLEAMARTLFQSWFVDFDPVRAKADCRDSGLPEKIAALFPDSFENSELGKIPKGWRASVLGDVVSRCGGRIQTGPFGSQLHASDYVVDGVPVVMPKDLFQRRVSTLSIARVALSDAQRLSRHRLEEGDIVYSRRGDVERHGLIRSREIGWLCGTGCLLVRLGPEWPSPLFASIALDRPETRAWIVQHAIGATMPNLNTGILARVPIVVPTDKLLHAFNHSVQPLADCVIANDAQSETLASLRDMLLTRLISGEVYVKDAERIAKVA